MRTIFNHRKIILCICLSLISLTINADSSTYTVIEYGKDAVNLEDSNTINAGEYVGRRVTLGQGVRVGLLQAEVRAGIAKGTSSYNSVSIFCQENDNNDCKEDIQAIISGASIRIGDEMTSFGPTIEFLSSGEKLIVGEFKVGGFKLGTKRGAPRLSLKLKVGEFTSSSGDKSDYLGTSVVLDI